ncbi:MAG: TIGR00725 family protein [bacterium]
MREAKLMLGVIGGRMAEDRLLKAALEVGRLIAQKGAILVCGGMSGVMEYAARGAKEAGGITVGILPTDSKGDANPYIDIPIVTGLGIARNVIVAKSSDAVIAVGGGYGTLSEIAHSLQIGKAVISLESWEIEGVIRAKDPEWAVAKAIELANQQ